MKRFLLILVAMLAFTGIYAQNTYVLIVGVSKYEDEHNLQQTTKDAKEFQKIMLKQTKNVTILTSKYANRSNILEKLSAICNRAQKNDRIIFYFSGHGYPGGIAAYDQLLSYEDINNTLAKSAARAKICLVDACHAGSVNNIGNSSFRAPSGNVIYMMACRDSEYSLEAYEVGHGLFTQALLKGIRGKADANKDRKITVRELFTYIHNDVVRAASKKGVNQHPQLIGKKDLETEVIASW